jgi:hypothetical protein
MQVREPHYFVDEQREGSVQTMAASPSLQKSKHRYRNDRRSELRIPLAIVGRLANYMFVEKTG